MISYGAFVAIVAMLNLLLGFGIAAYLGHRHRWLMAMADAALPAAGWGAPLPTSAADLAATASPVPATAQPAAPPVPAPTIAAPEPAASAEEEKPPAGDVAAESAGTSPQPPSPVAAAVVALQAEVGNHHQQITSADESLRSYMGTADAAAIEACLNSLMAATEEYLQRRDPLHKSFEETRKKQPELQDAGETVDRAMQHQNRQIQTSNESIRGLDLKEDLEGGCRKLLGETNKLLEANHQVRDSLDRALVQVERNEQRLDERDEKAYHDELTGMPGRAGLEAKLNQWWQKDPHRVRQLSVAMIDVDRFALVNERFGHRAGDELLRVLGQFLQNERREEGTATRFAGQRFAFLFPGSDLRYTVNLVERIRQTIELTHFRRLDADIQVTVSCAVTEANASDTSDSLFARAEATLREAKRYGRNRTFLHEGKYPTPVVPPNFSLEEKHVTL